MATDFNDDSFEPKYHRLDDDEESGPNLAPVTHRLTIARRGRNDVRERLSPIRAYLSDPRPDPQWEKMVAVLDVLLDIFWIISSMAVFHYTDFYVRLLYDQRMDRKWLMYSEIAFFVDAVIFGYYIVYLTCLRRVAPDNWDAHWRWGFPLATLSFFIFGICFTVAAWKIWWIFSPVILFLYFMGFVTVVSYIPDFGFSGNLNAAANGTPAEPKIKRKSTTAFEEKTV